MKLRAIVIGSGWAGEGHTLALRDAGVEVVAMCGRTPEATHAMAQKLGIPEVRFDWRKALDEFRPDIVSIATTAAPHCEMAVAAAQQGIHVACEKPLGLNAAEARTMLQAVERAGVKHVYAATGRYDPAYTYVRQLLAEGYIGQLQEIDYVIRFNQSRLSQFFWFHELGSGGGALNTGFTHMLEQVQYMTGATTVAVAGDARRLLDRLPIGPAVHDARNSGRFTVDPAQAEMGEWGKVDADQSIAVLLRLRTPNGDLINTAIRISLHVATRHPHYLTLSGTEGVLELAPQQIFWPTQIHHYHPQNNTWTELAVPAEILQAAPQVENLTQRDWNQLFREFAADIRGEGYCGYPTFHNGWLACEVIDIVRSGSSWQPVPEQPVG
jgi:predicted dehydrogenase